MSQLLRARSAESKAARRSAILGAALRTFEELGYSASTMDQVARHAHLAKGTLFLYFTTREALFLELLELLTEDWLVGLHDAIAQDMNAWSSAKLAGSVTETLEGRQPLARLVPLAGALEAGVSLERLAQYRRRILRRMFATGSLIEQRLGLSRPADGVLLLRCVIALAPALHDDPAELRAAITVLCNGFHRKA